jgi:antagonist of KipI
MIRVLSAGFLTTVQDRGRPGYAHLGVSAAGAADALSLRVANRLVGNPEGLPVLEMTLRGGRFSFEQDAVVSVCGSDFDCSISMWRAVDVGARSVVEIGGCRSGARCYLAVRGGFEAKYELGSASTHVLSGLGQLIQRGDLLRVGDRASDLVNGITVTVDRCFDLVRVTPGSETGEFDGGAVMDLLSRSWRVSEQSNRQGIRLSGGGAVALRSPGGGRMASEGVALGAIQVPPGGEPVILFVDSQTTGGYPVIANVASVDLGIVGQLRPGANVRFAAIDFSEAHRLLQEQEAWIRGI